MPRPIEHIEIISDEMAAVWRSMTGTQRIATAFKARARARTFIECAVRQQHPEYSEGQVRVAVAERLLGQPLPPGAAESLTR